MDRVCHFEIPYSDKQRMEKFYSDVFGWQFVPAPDGMPYTFAITTEVDEQSRPTQPGGINGGTYQREPDGPTSKSPVIVLEVESCEQRLKDIAAAGGTVLMEAQPVGDMGVYALVKDPEDNIIGLWQQLGNK